jgi:hypothetical protein
MKVDLQMRRRKCPGKNMLVAGEGFEPSKAEPGDLQSVAMYPRILV